MQRGEVKNQEFFSRRVLFSGLRYLGNITPTDFDLVIEFRDKAWVIGEAKHINSKGVPIGQRLALERIADDLWKCGKPAIAIVFEHNADGDIVAESCPVTEYRWRGEWKTMVDPITVKQCIDRFVNKHVVSNEHS